MIHNPPMTRVSGALISKVCFALALGCLGGLTFFYGLVRLGWLRHGASFADLRFLHLDWVFKPHLSYWMSHMRNLSTMFTGLVAIIGAGYLLLRSLLSLRPPTETKE